MQCKGDASYSIVTSLWRSCIIPLWRQCVTSCGVHTSFPLASMYHLFWRPHVTTSCGHASPISGVNVSMRHLSLASMCYPLWLPCGTPTLGINLVSILFTFCFHFDFFLLPRWFHCVFHVGYILLLFWFHFGSFWFHFGSI